VSFETIQRGIILLEQRRYEEAKAYFAQAAAQSPDDAQIIALLARCEYLSDEQEARALETIDRAIAIDPLDADFHTLRGHILLSLHKPRQALAASAEALRIDPANDDAWTLESAAHLQLESWADAERAARRALAIDPENATAANMLGEALRIQGRREETAAHVAERLAKDPLDPRTHAQAGWAALKEGDRDRAEEHFVEALRLDPHQEWARRGLVEAFKARSALYRAHLRYAFALERFNERFRWAFLVGLVVGVRVLRVVLGPYGGVVAVLYLLFVFWTFLASGVANCLLFLDRRARLALDRGQRWEGATVGFAVFGGVLALVAGSLLHMRPVLMIGFGLIGASIPLSRTFTNESRIGRVLFGSVAGLAVLAGIVSAAAPGDVAEALAGIALVAVVATTWLANVPALRR